MTDAQKRLRKLQEQRSKAKQRMAELSKEDTLNDETRAEYDELENAIPDTERLIRAAQTALDDEDAEAKAKGKEAVVTDPEMRERIELRGRCNVGRYLSSAIRGKMLSGPEAEFNEAIDLPPDAPDNAIPFELWQAPEQRDEHRAVTPAPGTTGINLDVLRPFVFAPSIASRLGVEMPMVESGTYATGTITQAATADAVAKSALVPETEGGFTTQSADPKRIGASLNLALEDIAKVGQSNFESLLREHISLVISDQLDNQALNGDGMNDDLIGIFMRLTDPGATTAVVDFDAYAAAGAGGVDGLWANELDQVSILVGAATFQHSAKTFQSAASFKGEMSAAAYAKKHTGGWWCNKRMPDAGTFESVDNVQQAILYRQGRSMMPNPMRTAVCPHWGYFSIDDIYSGATKGERRFVINTLVGDVILVQPDAYKQVAFQLL